MSLIKNKKRVKDHGEVYTPPELVNEMLDQLPQELWQENKTFLDPACGNGNILVEVVRRKISLGHCPLQALETTFGIDILQDNVDECKERLLEFTDKSDEAKFYVNKNIKCANSLEVDWVELFK